MPDPIQKLPMSFLSHLEPADAFRRLRTPPYPGLQQPLGPGVRARGASGGLRRPDLKPRPRRPDHKVAWGPGVLLYLRPLCSPLTCSCSRPRRAADLPATAAIPTLSAWASSAL